MCIRDSFTTRTPVTPQYDTDWQDELFSNAGIMRHNVSVIGGTKAIKYMASVGYMDQDGIIAPSNHNRINARINLDAQITKRLTASISYSMYDAKNTVVQAEGRMINDGVIQEEGIPQEIFGNPKSQRLQEFLSKVL